MNNLRGIYEAVKDFGERHEMVNEVILVKSEDELEGREFNYRTMVMMPLASAENVNDENTLIIHDARLANLFYQEYKKRLDEVTVNIDEVSAGINMKAFPNPAQNVLNIQLNELAQENMTISLTDLSGKVVGQWIMNSNFLQIETAAFSRGMYILSVQSARGIKSTKIQLQ